MILLSHTVELLAALSYRHEMRVQELMVFRSWRPETSFYLCPRCGITLEREFVKYCDRCGQCLDWTMHAQAKIVYPEKKRRAKTKSLDPAHK